MKVKVEVTNIVWIRPTRNCPKKTILELPHAENIRKQITYLLETFYPAKVQSFDYVILKGVK